MNSRNGKNVSYMKNPSLKQKQSKQFSWVCYHCKHEDKDQRGHTNYIQKKNSNGQALEKNFVNLEAPIIGNLWIHNIYNSHNQDLNISKIFESTLQNMLIKSSTVHTTTDKKLLERIDEGNFKLPNNGYPTYQSNQRKSQSTLDLDFCSHSVFNYFDNFQAMDDFGSDHSATPTSLKLKLQTDFDMKAKVIFKKFKKHAKVK